MNLFSNRLAYKIGVAIILVEVAVLMATGFVYIRRFNAQIDQRLYERIELPGSLVAKGLLTFSSVADEAVMRDLVGETLLGGMVVSSDKRVFTSLHPQDVRRNVADLPGINPDWFDESTSSQMVLETAVGLISITPVYGFADDNTPFFVYIRASTETAQREKQTVAGLFILGSILSVIATSAVIIIVFNTTILQRITAVLGVLQRVESGQLQARVDEPIASDEIGVLQTGVNSMIATLHHTIEALEQRVNELHEAREALYTSESRFKSLIENSYDGILLYNKEEIIQYASPSIKQILGYTAEELIGKKDSDLTAEADTAEVKTIFANLRAQPGKGTAFRQRIKHKDGTLVWLEVTGTNLLYDPHVNAIVWNFRNITKRVEQEKQIQQQERLAAVGQLAAGIAHDFNNILAVIVLYSQLALKNNQLPQALQKHLQVVAEQAQRAADLVVQILDFSRRAILERRPMDLGALLKEMVKLWRRTLPENITVSLEQDTNTPLINADPTRIQQVFMNLAVNARDAMPDGGRLHIRIEQRDLEPGSHNLPDVAPGRWVQVAVADTGIGVAPEAITRLFEPFYSTKGAKGTGLGLAQVYGIVKQHEGHIGVTSQLGEGTTFTILLPPVAQTETTAVKKSGDIVVEGGGETILLVEDEKALRDALAYGLQTINYRVISAENGQDALSVYSETDENVALVLCDMVMPQMGGMKLLHQFRVKGLTLPFIIMTGHPFEADLSGLQAEGLTDWILKPVDLKSLSHLLVRALHQEQQPDTA